MNQDEHKTPTAPRIPDGAIHPEPVLSGAPSLRELRGNRKSQLWGEVAALLARGPVLRDIDDD